MSGFQITCLRCGTSMNVVPGFRDVPNEPIRFGTDLRDFVQCKCGNEIHSGYEYALEKEVCTWVDASMKMNIPDESTVYGISCPGGKCEM